MDDDLDLVRVRAAAAARARARQAEEVAQRILGTPEKPELIPGLAEAPFTPVPRSERPPEAPVALPFDRTRELLGKVGAYTPTGEGLGPLLEPLGPTLAPIAAGAGVAGLMFNQPIEEVGQQFERAKALLQMRTAPAPGNKAMEVGEMILGVLPLGPAMPEVGPVAPAIKAAVKGLPESAVAALDLETASTFVRNSKNWLVYGRKAGNPLVAGEGRGSGFGRLIQDYGAERAAVPIIAKSEGSKVAQAFSALPDAQREALDKAIYLNRHYGTPIPAELKEGAEAALAVRRRSVSELDAIRQELDYFGEEVKFEYPSWEPRAFEEPIKEAAAMGRSGKAPIPGMPGKKFREDTYWMETLLSPDQAEKVLEQMPPELRPVQPAAPTMSKGMIEKSADGTLIQWPNTDEGFRGWNEFERLATEQGKPLLIKPPGFSPFGSVPTPIDAIVQDALPDGFKLMQGTGWKPVVSKGSPVPNIDLLRKELDVLFPEEARMGGAMGGVHPLELEAGDLAKLPPRLREQVVRLQEDFAQRGTGLTPIVDSPSLLARGWTQVGIQKANENLFSGLIGLTDDTGEPLTHFVTHADFHKGVKPPEGYSFLLDDAGRPSKRWGALNRGMEEQKGLYAVRNDVIKYLKDTVGEQDDSARILHDFLDYVAVNQTNGLSTGIMNKMQVLVWQDSINGTSRLTSAGREAYREATGVAKGYAETGILHPYMEEMARNGLPVHDGIKGAIEVGADPVGFADKFNAIYEAYGMGDKESVGRKLAEVVTASPLAEKASTSALGGAIQGGLTALTEGEGLTGVALRAAAGAAESTALRPVARSTLAWFRGTDEVATIAAYIHHRKDFLQQFIAQGMAPAEAEAAAVRAAAAKTRDLTQAGWWTRLGGFGEVVAGASSKAVPDQNWIRGVQKALLNRYLKWNEVQTRMGVAALFKYGVKEKIAAVAAAGTLGAVMYGMDRAVVGVGQLTEEELARAKERHPGAIVVPTPKGPVAVNARPLSSNPFDIPGFGGITGPAFQSGVEALTGKTVSGYPIQRTETTEGEKEGAVEGFARIQRGRYLSPWALGGRYEQNMEEGVRENLQGNTNARSLPQIALTPLLGVVRDVDPKETLSGMTRAFQARMGEILDDARAVNSKLRSVGQGGNPGLSLANRTQQAERLADLMQDYLKMGLPEGRMYQTLDRKKWAALAAAKQILIKRGVIKPPIPGVK